MRDPGDTFGENVYKIYPGVDFDDFVPSTEYLCMIQSAITCIATVDVIQAGFGDLCLPVLNTELVDRTKYIVCLIFNHNACICK